MMKTTTKRLFDAVSSVGSIIKPQSTLPIIKNLYVELADSQLSITADNLEARSTVSIAVESKETLKACIPYDVFSNILKGIPDGSIELKFKNTTVDIQYPNGNYSIPRIDHAEFPEKKIVESDNRCTLNALMFSEALKSASSFIDDQRMDVLANGMVLVNSNACFAVGIVNHSGVEVTVECESDCVDSRILLKKSSMKYLSDALQVDSEVHLNWDDKRLNVYSEDIDFTVVLSEGKYPDYAKVFNQDKKNPVLSAQDGLLKSVKRLETISDKDNSTVKVSLLSNKIKVSLSNSSHSYSGNEEFDVSYDSQEMEIAFNLKFLKKALQSVSDEAILYIEAPNKAMFFQDDNARGFIAPVVIQN